MENSIKDIVQTYPYKFDLVNKNEILNLLKISYATSQSLDSEIQNNITLDINLVVGTFILITFFPDLFLSFFANEFYLKIVLQEVSLKQVLKMHLLDFDNQQALEFLHIQISYHLYNQIRLMYHLVRA